MDKKIRIYEIDNKFCFTVNKFSSRSHSKLTSFVNPNYKYAWQALDDAKKIANKHSYHLEGLERFAMQDLTKDVVSDISSETMLGDHYEIIYDGLVDTAVGMEIEDKLQKKVNYLEAKAVLTELLFLIEKVPEDEIGLKKEKENAESRLNSVVKKIKKLVHKYYSEDLAEDKKKQEEVGAGDMGGMPPPEGGMPAMPPMDSGMSMASSRPFMKMAQSLDKECVDELIDEYGKRACQAIAGKHPKVLFSRNENGIELKESKDIIVSISIDKDYFIEDINPEGKVEELYPYHSLEFYQAYWKPIVEKIGHCCVGNNSSVLITEGKSLPDLPKNFPHISDKFQTINKKSKQVHPCCVSFRGDKPSWFVEQSKVEKTASSQHTEEDYYQNGKGAMVVCTDPELQSYYKKTGNVVQVIPFGDSVEVDINFGNHICRMTEDQFEIIDGL